MTKHASPDHPIHELIAKRWSPYGYEPKAVAAEDLRSILEAARWAASSYNEQPWRFLVARREDKAAFQRALECLVGPNQEWARNAGVLILAAVSTRFAKNDKPNRVAEHDLGLASGNMCVEATHRGLFVHMMAGVDLDKVRENYGVPEGFDPVTAIAIGHAADPSALEGAFLERDTTPRTRKPLAEIAFGDAWGKPAELG